MSIPVFSPSLLLLQAVAEGLGGTVPLKANCFDQHLKKCFPEVSMGSISSVK